MKPSAVIFDLDGTVLDNEDEYGASFKKVLESLGAKDVPDFPHVRGIGVKENWPGLLEKYNLKTDKSPQELAHKTQEEYLKMLDRVHLKEGCEEFIGDLKAEGIKTALATSNERWVVEEVFAKLKLDRLFDTATTAEEVSYRKPNPDLFLLTAGKLGVKTNECLVIEDAASGVEAAKRAGMKVWAIAWDERYKGELKGADRIVFGYNELIKNG